VDPLRRALSDLHLDVLLPILAGLAALAFAVLAARTRHTRARLRGLASRAHALDHATPPPEAHGKDEVAALARQLHAAQARLAEERAAREAFLLRALDEVRRPLGLLSTSLELALRRRPEVPELTAAVQDAQREADRIARLAGRLATLQTLGRTAQRTAIDLAPLARSVYQLALPQATRAGLELTLAAPQSFPVSGDGALLSLAMTELIDNALKAARFGGHVSLELSREGASWRVAVRDDGPGIPAERREQVFEPLSHGASGVGAPALGLALVREIARAHGGRAVLVPTEGRGALVALEWPAAVAVPG
jgi:two-component system sensor histidine kinase TctE